MLLNILYNAWEGLPEESITWPRSGPVMEVQAKCTGVDGGAEGAEILGTEVSSRKGGVWYLLACRLDGPEGEGEDLRTFRD